MLGNLPSYFPEDCIMSFFVICGVVISSSASWRNPFLSVLPWGFPQELAVKFLIWLSNKNNFKNFKPFGIALL